MDAKREDYISGPRKKIISFMGGCGKERLGVYEKVVKFDPMGNRRLGMELDRGQFGLVGAF